MDKALATQNLLDIDNLQWRVLNEKSFRYVFELLGTKHSAKPDLKAALKRFFKYMRGVWVKSREFRWYEGANPWSVSNNQGVEGKNKEIKQSHTFSVLMRMVEEWSEEDDTILISSMMAPLSGQQNRLSIKTDIYWG